MCDMLVCATCHRLADPLKAINVHVCLCCYQTCLSGVQVTPAITDPATGQVTAGPAFTLRAFLTGIHADSPARAMLQKSVGCFIALLVCMHCGITAEKVAGVNRYRGYTQATVASCGPRAGCSFVMGADDSDRQYTADEMLELATAAEQISQAGDADAAGTLGVHGLASPLKLLWYTSPDTLFIVPFVHMAVHGVFKDWLKAVFAKRQRRRKQPNAKQRTAGRAPAGLCNSGLHQQQQQQQQQQPGAAAGGAADGDAAAANLGAVSALPLPSSKPVAAPQRRLISSRAAGVVAHPLCGRTYRDVVDKCQSWTMEEGMRAPMWLAAMFRAALTSSAEQQLLDPVCKAAYGHLRRWLDFHLTGRSFDTQEQLEAAAQEAAKELLQYARLAQEVRDKGNVAVASTASQ